MLRCILTSFLFKISYTLLFKLTTGFPNSSLNISISFTPKPLNPVPNALLTASFAAKFPAITSLLNPLDSNIFISFSVNNYKPLCSFNSNFDSLNFNYICSYPYNHIYRLTFSNILPHRSEKNNSKYQCLVNFFTIISIIRFIWKFVSITSYYVN